jgi:hypothetical protein
MAIKKKDIRIMLSTNKILSPGGAWLTIAQKFDVMADGELHMDQEVYSANTNGSAGKRELKAAYTNWTGKKAVKFETHFYTLPDGSQKPCGFSAIIDAKEAI